MKKKKITIGKVVALTVGIGFSLTSFGQNTNYGQYSLDNIAYGWSNSAFGYSALKMSTSASYNSAFGHEALLNNTGNDNSAFGAKALKSNTTGRSNSSFGEASLLYNSEGSFNSAFGTNALFQNTKGFSNSAFGSNALYFNTTGSSNTAIGGTSLKNNTIGNGNVAVGFYSLSSNTSGNSNVAIGRRALVANTTGSNNTSVGMYSLTTNKDGFQNTSMGYQSLYANVSGSYNVAFGDYALAHHESGNDNTALGSFAGTYSPNSIVNSMSLGNMTSATASNTVVIGNTNITNIGGQVGWSTLSDGRFKKNVENDVPGIEFIQKLRPVTYNYNLSAYNKLSGFDIMNDTLISDEKRRSFLAQQAKSEAITYTGFIAQEVEEAAKDINYNFSGVVKPQSDMDHYSIRYAEFVVPLVKATQEQQEELESLKSEIAELKQMIRDLASNSAIEKVENKNASSVKISPNPTDGRINLTMENVKAENVQVSVFNLSGELIFNQTVNNRSELQIDISNQPAGQYIIQTNMDGKLFQNRVFIQK